MVGVEEGKLVGVNEGVIVSVGVGEEVGDGVAVPVGSRVAVGTVAVGGTMTTNGGDARRPSCQTQYVNKTHITRRMVSPPNAPARKRFWEELNF